MTSTAASAPPDMSERSDREIPRWRLHVLRAIALPARTVIQTQRAITE